MKPYLFRSIIYRGMWACALARPDRSGRRKWEPVPHARIIYGDTPRAAYLRWKEYHMAALYGEMKGGPDVGSARS